MACRSLMTRIWTGSLPLATLAVNVLGCFLIGLLMQSESLDSLFINRNFRMVVTVGFLGAFTTFSAFSHETASLIQERLWLMAAGNIGANVILAIVATAMGIWIGRLVFVSAS